MIEISIKSIFLQIFTQKPAFLVENQKFYEFENLSFQYVVEGHDEQLLFQNLF